MNIEKLKQQREKIDKQILEFEAKELEEKKKKENQISKLIWNRYKCLPGIEVSQIIVWTKPYNEIPIPKGCYLSEVPEIWKLIESDERDKFLGEFKGQYNLFWCKQTKYAKENNYSVELHLGRSLDLGAYYGDLASSSVVGRVVFCREVKK